MVLFESFIFFPLYFATYVRRKYARLFHKKHVSQLDNKDNNKYDSFSVSNKWVSKVDKKTVATDCSNATQCAEKLKVTTHKRKSKKNSGIFL